MIINEVIENGFEKDLLPNNDVDSSVSAQLIKNTINYYSGDRFAGFVNFGAITKQLAQKYKIFDILNEKMNHERHKEMGFPLHEYQMLSLILYCNGNCNHNLCESQRDGKWKTKWRGFDRGLQQAIEILGKYEIHDEYIYTGLAGIFLDLNQLYCQASMSFALFFKTNDRFSRDIQVAREFRVDEGLIIGVNLHRTWPETKHPIHACDVSWISKFPTEQEVLVSRYAWFRPCLSKFRQIGKKQWVVCNAGDDEKSSFENVFKFLMHKRFKVKS